MHKFHEVHKHKEKILQQSSAVKDYDSYKLGKQLNRNIVESITKKNSKSDDTKVSDVDTKYEATLIHQALAENFDTIMIGIREFNKNCESSIETKISNNVGKSGKEIMQRLGRNIELEPKIGLNDPNRYSENIDFDKSIPQICDKLNVKSIKAATMERDNGYNEIAKKASSSPNNKNVELESLSIKDNFDMFGSFHDFYKMQNEDFKPLQRKNIKITIKGDKHIESKQLQSVNLNNCSDQESLTLGQMNKNEILNHFNILGENRDNLKCDFSINDMQSLYESEVSKKENVDNSTDSHILPLNLPILNSHEEDHKKSISCTKSLHTSVNMIEEHEGNISPIISIETEALEILELFHSLSTNFGVLSKPINLLHEKFTDYKKKGAPLLECFDEDAVALLDMISNKLNNFLKAPDISLVQSTLYKLASSRLVALMVAVDKAKSDESKTSDIFLHNLDLHKIAKACEGKDCLETIKFIKVTLIYQNLPELSSDQLMEAYIAIKAAQASFLSQNKSSESNELISHNVSQSSNIPHPQVELNSSVSSSESSNRNLSQFDISSYASNKLNVPTFTEPSKSLSSRSEHLYPPKLLTYHDQSKPRSSSQENYGGSHNPSTSEEDKINLSLSSNGKHNSNSVLLPVMKSTVIKRHSPSKSNVTDKKKLHKLHSVDHKTLKKKHSDYIRSRSPSQKKSLGSRHSDSRAHSSEHKFFLGSRHLHSKKAHSPNLSKPLGSRHTNYSESHSADQNKLLRSQHLNSSKSYSLDEKKFINSAHHRNIPTNIFRDNLLLSSKSNLQSTTVHSSHIKNESSKPKHYFSRSPSLNKKSLRAKHHNPSRSPSFTKTKSLKTNHYSTRPSPEQKKFSKSKYSFSSRPISDEKKSSHQNKGDHYYSPESPTSPEDKKLSSSSMNKRCSSPKMSPSYNKRNYGRKTSHNSYQFQKEVSKPVFSLSIANVKPTPLPKFNIFENIDDDDDDDDNADRDSFKNSSRKPDYVFRKREPVESFLVNCSSEAEERYIRELYKRIHNMDTTEKIKYYIVYNSHSENVKRLLAVHADEIALVDPNLAQSMKWRIANVSKKNSH